jgi:nitrite reductase (NADH) small subunit
MTRQFDLARPTADFAADQSRDDGWVAVCRYDDLLPERGVAALVGDEQVAVFRTFDGMLHAIDNRDPFSGAFVLSRGIVGTAGDVPTVASPLFKQAFDLRTGRCLSEPAVAVPVHEVRRSGELVEVRLGTP